MADVADVSDTPPEKTPSSIETVGKISARQLSRNTAMTLRAVADQGHSFAVEHFGRVVGFLIPSEGRVPVRRGKRVVYEVPESEPLLELDEVQSSIVGTLYRLGKAVPGELIGDHDVQELVLALGRLELSQPRLLVKGWHGYQLTEAGVRHAEELGL